MLHDLVWRVRGLFNVTTWASTWAVALVRPQAKFGHPATLTQPGNTTLLPLCYMYGILCVILKSGLDNPDNKYPRSKYPVSFSQ